MQDRCENTDRKSKGNECRAEKGWGYIRSIAVKTWIAFNGGKRVKVQPNFNDDVQRVKSEILKGQYTHEIKI